MFSRRSIIVLLTIFGVARSTNYSILEKLSLKSLVLKTYSEYNRMVLEAKHFLSKEISGDFSLELELESDRNDKENQVDEYQKIALNSKELYEILDYILYVERSVYDYLPLESFRYEMLKQISIWERYFGSDLESSSKIPVKYDDVFSKYSFEQSREIIKKQLENYTKKFKELYSLNVKLNYREPEKIFVFFKFILLSDILNYSYFDVEKLAKAMKSKVFFESFSEEKLSLLLKSIDKNGFLRIRLTPLLDIKNSSFGTSAGAQPTPEALRIFNEFLDENYPYLKKLARYEEKKRADSLIVKEIKGIEELVVTASSRLDKLEETLERLKMDEQSQEIRESAKRLKERIEEMMQKLPRYEEEAENEMILAEKRKANLMRKRFDETKRFKIQMSSFEKQLEIEAQNVLKRLEEERKKELAMVNQEKIVEKQEFENTNSLKSQKPTFEEQSLTKNQDDLKSLEEEGTKRPADKFQEVVLERQRFKNVLKFWKSKNQQPGNN